MTPVRGGKTSHQRRSDGGGHSGPPFRGRKKRNNRGGRAKAAMAKAGAGANNGATSGTSQAEAAIPVGSNPEVNKGIDQADDHLQDLDDTADADVNGDAAEADDAEDIADEINGSAVEPLGEEAPGTAPTATEDADVPHVDESSSKNAASAPDIDTPAATEPSYDPAGPSGPEDEVPSQQLNASAPKEGDEDAGEEENEEEEEEEIEGDEVEEEEEGDEAEEDDGEEADEDEAGDMEECEGGEGDEDEMEQDDPAVETNDISPGENPTLVQKSASLPASEKKDTKIETATAEAALSSETNPVNEADVETSKLKDSGDTPASTAAIPPTSSSVNSTTPVPAGSAPPSAAAKKAGDITADADTKKTGPEKTKAVNPLSVSGGNRWSPHVSSPQGDVSSKGLILYGNNEDVKVSNVLCIGNQRVLGSSRICVYLLDFTNGNFYMD